MADYEHNAVYRITVEDAGAEAKLAALQAQIAALNKESESGSKRSSAARQAMLKDLERQSVALEKQIQQQKKLSEQVSGRPDSPATMARQQIVTDVDKRSEAIQKQIDALKRLREAEQLVERDHQRAVRDRKAELGAYQKVAGQTGLSDRTLFGAKGAEQIKQITQNIREARTEWKKFADDLGKQTSWQGFRTPTTRQFYDPDTGRSVGYSEQGFTARDVARQINEGLAARRRAEQAALAEMHYRTAGRLDEPFDVEYARGIIQRTKGYAGPQQGTPELLNPRTDRTRTLAAGMIDRFLSGAEQARMVQAANTGRLNSVQRALGGMNTGRADAAQFGDVSTAATELTRIEGSLLGTVAKATEAIAAQRAATVTKTGAVHDLNDAEARHGIIAQATTESVTRAREAEEAYTRALEKLAEIRDTGNAKEQQAAAKRVEDARKVRDAANKQVGEEQQRFQAMAAAQALHGEAMRRAQNLGAHEEALQRVKETSAIRQGGDARITQRRRDEQTLANDRLVGEQRVAKAAAETGRVQNAAAHDLAIGQELLEQQEIRTLRLRQSAVHLAAMEKIALEEAGKAAERRAAAEERTAKAFAERHTLRARTTARAAAGGARPLSRVPGFGGRVRGTGLGQAVKGITQTAAEMGKAFQTGFREADEAGAKTVTTMEKVKAGLGTLLGAVRSGGGGSGGLFGPLAAGAKDFGNRVGELAGKATIGLFSFRGLVIAATAAIGPLIAGVGALGASFIGLGDAFVSVLGTAIALPGAFAAIGTTMAVLIAAVQPLAGVFQAYNNYVKASNTSSLAFAQNQMAAKMAVSDAAHAVKDASIAVSNAQFSELTSQLSLNDARREAIRNLTDLKNALDKTGLDEKGARLALKQAEADYRKTMADGNATQLDREEALQRVQEAQYALRDTLLKNNRTQEDYNTAQKRGVDGSLQVLGATNAVQNAQNGYADATYNLTKAQYELAKAQREAAHGGTQAYTAWMALQDALSLLGPKTRDFANLLIGSGTALRQLRNQVSDRIFGPMITPMGQLLKLLAGNSGLNALLMGAADAVGQVGAQMITAFKAADPLFGKLAGANKQVIATMGDALVHVADAFAHIAVIAEPFVLWLAREIDGLAKAFDRWSQIAAGSSVTKFFMGLETTLPIIAKIAGNVMSTLGSLFMASQPFFGWFLGKLSDVTGGWAKWGKAQNDAADPKHLSPFRKFLEDTKPLVQSVWGFVKQLVVSIGQIAADPNNIKEAKRIFDELAHVVLPDLVAIISRLSESKALSGIVDLLGKFFDAVKRFLDSGGALPLEKFVGTLLTLFTAFFKLMTGSGLVNRIIRDIAEGLAVLAGALVFAKFTGILGLITNLGKLFGLLKDIAVVAVRAGIGLGKLAFGTTRGAGRMAARSQTGQYVAATPAGRATYRAGRTVGRAGAATGRFGARVGRGVGRGLRRAGDAVTDFTLARPQGTAARNRANRAQRRASLTDRISNALKTAAGLTDQGHDLTTPQGRTVAVASKLDRVIGLLEKIELNTRGGGGPGGAGHGPAGSPEPEGPTGPRHGPLTAAEERARIREEAARRAGQPSEVSQRLAGRRGPRAGTYTDFAEPVPAHVQRARDTIRSVGDTVEAYAGRSTPSEIEEFQTGRSRARQDARNQRRLAQRGGYLDPTMTPGVRRRRGEFTPSAIDEASAIGLGTDGVPIYPGATERRHQQTAAERRQTSAQQAQLRARRRIRDMAERGQVREEFGPNAPDELELPDESSYDVQGPAQRTKRQANKAARRQRLAEARRQQIQAIQDARRPPVEELADEVEPLGESATPLVEETSPARRSGPTLFNRVLGGIRRRRAPSEGQLTDDLVSRMQQHTASMLDEAHRRRYEALPLEERLSRNALGGGEPPSAATGGYFRNRFNRLRGSRGRGAIDVGTALFGIPAAAAAAGTVWQGMRDRRQLDDYERIDPAGAAEQTAAHNIPMPAARLTSGMHNMYARGAGGFVRSRGAVRRAAGSTFRGARRVFRGGRRALGTAGAIAGGLATIDTFSSLLGGPSVLNKVFGAPDVDPNDPRLDPNSPQYDPNYAQQIQDQQDKADRNSMLFSTGLDLTGMVGLQGGDYYEDDQDKRQQQQNNLSNMTDLIPDRKASRAERRLASTAEKDLVEEAESPGARRLLSRLPGRLGTVGRLAGRLGGIGERLGGLGRFAGGLGRIGGAAGKLLKGGGILGIAGAATGMLADAGVFGGKGSTGKALGQAGGAALTGAGIGATIGSVIPGVGTVVGGAIGAGVGLGYSLYKNPKLRKDAEDMWKSTWDGFKKHVGGPFLDFFGKTIPNFFTKTIPHWLESFGAARYKYIDKPLTDFITKTIPHFFTTTIPHWFVSVAEWKYRHIDKPIQDFINGIPGFFTHTIPHWFESAWGWFKAKVVDPVWNWFVGLPANIARGLENAFVTLGGLLVKALVAVIKAVPGGDLALKAAEKVKSVITGQQSGGPVTGTYTGAEDTEHRRLTPGEWVVRRNAVQQPRGAELLADINEGRVSAADFYRALDANLTPAAAMPVNVAPAAVAGAVTNNNVRNAGLAMGDVTINNPVREPSARSMRRQLQSLAYLTSYER